MCAQMNYAQDVAKETTINLRVDQETKDRAAEIFARCGFTTSNAIRLFLLRAIKEDDWPFDIHQLGPQTMADLDYSIAHPEEYTHFNSVEELMADLMTPDEDEDQPVVTKSKKRARR